MPLRPDPLRPDALPAPLAQFLAERHLATLTTLRPDRSPHVVPVGFTWDGEARIARVICDGRSIKARNAASGGRAALCQVDGRRWVTLEGEITLRDDPAAVDDAVRRYAGRHRTPRPDPARVVLTLAVDRVLAWPGWTA